jgi:hypothetical protein
VSAAALLLVSSIILYCFSVGSVLNAYAIAASFPKYRFCSNLMPSVKEKVFSFSFLYRGGLFWIALLHSTTLLRAELLIVIYIDPPVSVCVSGVLPLSVCTRSFYGASVNGLMVFSVSISISFSASTT